MYHDPDDAYANGKYIAGADNFPPAWAERAAEFRRSLQVQGRARLGIAHGRHPRERLDLFLPEEPAKGLVVFIHGGYWRAFDRSSWSWLARGPLAQGFAVAMPEYPLAPEASLARIGQSVAAAVACAANAVDGPVVLCGHSAGGQLSARLVARGTRLPAAVLQRVARIVPISGLFDLRPLVATAMNADLRLDARSARGQSPALLGRASGCAVTAWVGGDERPAFIEQSAILGRAWPDVAVHVEPGRHHFDVIDDLADPRSRLCAVVCG